jgi:hypothetical protein
MTISSSGIQVPVVTKSKLGIGQVDAAVFSLVQLIDELFYLYFNWFHEPYTNTRSMHFSDFFK